MEQDLLQLFDNYLFDKLNSEDKIAFENSLISDNSLKSEFDEYLAIVEGINIHEYDKLKIRLAEIRTQHDKKINKIRYLRISASIAAVIIILLIPSFIIYQNFTRHTRLYDKYYIEDSGVPVVMGASNSSGFASAMTEFKDKNYELALKKFNQLSVKNIENDTLSFYSGLCQLNLNNYGNAIETFGTINNTESDYYFASKYYLALALIKLKDYKNAVTYLTEAGKCNNCIYKDNSLKLIHEIK